MSLLEDVLEFEDERFFQVYTKGVGPTGRLPLTEEMLRTWASGDLFGWTQNAGMGWDVNRLASRQILLLSTQGGIREPDGTPIALGYHTGHWELGLLTQAAAKTLRAEGAIPFAAYVSDPCDGRSQGTSAMFDSLPYRNDAALVMRRLIRSLPTREAVMGFATCDKGLPATMIALASFPNVPVILVPGGVTLPPEHGEDAGTVQTIGARFTHGEMTLEDAAEMGCRACATPGGGCQFLGTAATSQVVAEAMGLALPHSALAPSGQPIWEEIARQSAEAILHQMNTRITSQDILTDAAIHNAMVVHAAFGGSTNLLLHIPAIAHAAKRSVPSVKDWTHVNHDVPRLVSVLPNGPEYHPTVRVFLAGGVPEVMLQLRKDNLLDERVLTATGEPLHVVLDWWENSERRWQLRKRLVEQDGISPDRIIMDRMTAKQRGMTSTVTFPTGNLAPEGAVIKSTAIDPSVVDDDGVYRHTGPVKAYTSERAAIEAIKTGTIVAGDVLVLMGRGPSGTGMEETYQLTSALKHLSFGKQVCLITDARFSGVSTGACIGHVGPEALAGGPLGKLRDGDIVSVVIDTQNLVGTVDFVGEGECRFHADEGTAILAARPAHPGLKADPDLPDDTRLWAALQGISGGTWRGSVYDVDQIIEVLEAGKKALGL
ncbi:YjhG/YagF family D-xylonate dehydratase [Alicyclobacillus ferrooxydans]|uniref:YjhG/YagF family D-xylonate dehydratase n=1 Tax=Alicyclobacillus ferrooxydans TaxID=471514 RepID=UPI0006D55FD2|nr:YjhG/YagF family D-xylonate dehydratase [Alicyclobacillus ferrooxydans]